MGMMMLPVNLLTITSAKAQNRPQVKIDLSMGNRQDDQVVEPGFTAWKVRQGKADTLTVDGVRFVLSVAPDAPCELQVGWNKTLILNAENREKNGRLTYDGVTLSPRIFGAFKLRIEGLPTGTHTLRTYHHCWENPSAFYVVPMTVKYNGQTVHELVGSTMGQAVAANCTLLTTELTVENEGDAVELDFFTSEDAPGTPDRGQANVFCPPLLTAFELNTPDIPRQAKAPWPANGDMHTNADGGGATLHWAAASNRVRQHRLHFGTSGDNMPLVATLTDTVCAVNGLYSMHTYYWRVDEVEADGTVTEGQTWTFKPRQLAFPGAEGYGRFAQGGRGGTVYHVTNLRHDHTPGSLIYGRVDVEGPHTIVFDVSGTIEMDFGHVFTRPGITIAGQTAPGKGVCLKAANVNIGSDNICRFMRFKRGYGPTGNAMGMTGADHSIVDHCTAAWGTDVTVSGRGA